MIYLDNSATTRIKPKQVITQTLKGLTTYSANGTRSSHRLSIETGMQINLVREKVRKFVKASSIESVIFTSNCTEALNYAILGSVKSGGHVVCTINEHNSVLRPLYHLEKVGEITLSVAESKNNERITWQDIKEKLQPNTYLVCVNHISNVDGMAADITEIGKNLKARNIMLLVDAAQSVGHEKIDMQQQNISYLAFAPHKGLYSPQGVGVLVLGNKAGLNPIKFGGTGTESFDLKQPTSLPEMLETGTLPLPSILGLGAGIDFVRENFEQIREKIEDLATYLNFELRKINNVVVYTHPNNCSGVISFNIKGKTSEEICLELDEKYKICARGGLHCAPLKHKNMQTLKTGSVRVSLCFFNNFTQIATLIKAVKQLANNKGC